MPYLYQLPKEQRVAIVEKLVGQDVMVRRRDAEGVVPGKLTSLAGLVEGPFGHARPCIVLDTPHAGILVITLAGLAVIFDAST